MTQLELFEVPDNHYNTTNESGATLAEMKDRAKTQNQFILDLFAMNPRMTPSVCEKFAAIKGEEWPITSIRRAISDLTAAGFLRKTDQLVEGNYGAREHIWQYVRRQEVVR